MAGPDQRTFACNSTADTSRVSMQSLKFEAFHRAADRGRRGIACEIGEVGVEGLEGLAVVRVGGGGAWSRCRWVAAGPGRASRSTAPSRQARVWRSRGRAAAHRHTERPGRTRQIVRSGLRAGRRPRAHKAARPHSRALRRPEHPWGAQTKTSGTGRRHDPRLGRQGAQSCNPESVRNVGGATRPAHAQGRPDKRNDVLGGPAQAS